MMMTTTTAVLLRVVALLSQEPWEPVFAETKIRDFCSLLIGACPLLVDEPGPRIVVRIIK